MSGPQAVRSFGEVAQVGARAVARLRICLEASLRRALCRQAGVPEMTIFRRHPSQRAAFALSLIAAPSFAHDFWINNGQLQVAGRQLALLRRQRLLRGPGRRHAPDRPRLAHPLARRDHSLQRSADVARTESSGAASGMTDRAAASSRHSLRADRAATGRATAPSASARCGGCGRRLPRCRPDRAAGTRRSRRRPDAAG